MNIRKIFCSLLALAVVLSLTGCETYQAFKAAFIDPKEEKLPAIKIGIFEPLTGANASAAAEEVAGIELAHSLYPSVLGRDIELVYADNQSDLSSCPTVAESLISQGVKFIIGSYKSIFTLAASDVIKEAGIPAISCTNTNPIITATNPYYFRVCCIDSYEGESAADYILNCVGSTKAAIVIKEGNDYASTLAQTFKESFEEAVGESTYTALLTEEELTAEETSRAAVESASRAAIEEAAETAAKDAKADAKAEKAAAPADTDEDAEVIPEPVLVEVEREYAPIITIPEKPSEEEYMQIFDQIKILNPDVVYFPGSSSEASEIITLSRSLGYDFTWLGTSQWNGITLEDVYYTIDFDPEEELSEMTTAFNNAYTEKFGTEKTPTDEAALGFDAYLLAIEAISLQGPYAAGWQYAEALSEVTDMKGATGNISMDASGNPIKEITVEHTIDADGKSVAVYSSIPSSQIREKIEAASDAAVEK